MYQSAHHTKCLSEMTKISKSYTLETFNGRNFPGSSKDKSLTTNKHPKITTDPLKDWRHEALLQKVTQWLCEGRRASAPKWLMFFFCWGCNIFFGCKKPKNNTYGTLEIHFFLLGWFLCWFRGISKHKLWSTFLWCWNMQSSKDMLNLKHMRQGRRDFTVETKDFAASILLRFSCRESCSRCFCWRFPIILDLFSLFCTNWQHFQEGWSHAAKVW